MSMTDNELTEHLHEHHGIDVNVAREVIGVRPGGEDPQSVTVTTQTAYLRGFHDGLHGRVDADELPGLGHEREVGR